MARILITGTAGFIGFHLVQRLADEGHQLVGLDNINDYYDVRLKFARLAASGIPHEAVDPGVMIQSRTLPGYRFIKADLTDKLTLMHLFEREDGFDYVVHLAAQAGVRYSLENPDAYIQSNINGFMNLLECCRMFPPKHLVYASSSSVYGDSPEVPFREEQSVDCPVSLYAATKKSNELMAHSYSHLFGIPSTGLRFFTVYGPWGRPDMSPILFASAILKDEPIKVFNEGNMERDFTYVDDIVEGTCRTVFSIPRASQPTSSQSSSSHTSSSQPDVDVARLGVHWAGSAPYRIMNIGHGSPCKLLEFIELLEKHLGKKAKKVMMPMQPGDVHKTWADTSLLEADTGYKPVISLDEGLRRFAEWFRDYQ